MFAARDLDAEGPGEIGVAENGSGGAVGEHAALVEQDEAVAEAAGEAKIVQDDDHAGAGRLLTSCRGIAKPFNSRASHGQGEGRVRRRPPGDAPRHQPSRHRDAGQQADDGPRDGCLMRPPNRPSGSAPALFCWS